MPLCTHRQSDEIRSVASNRASPCLPDQKYDRNHQAKYVAPMVELRKSRGLTPEQAAEQLSDTVVLATMMLAEDDVDGWYRARYTPPPTPSARPCN